MFTGIVQEIGTLRASRSAASAASVDSVRLDFGASEVLEGARVGDSISVNGCCLTVVDLGLGWWAAEAVDETLSRTNLSDLVPGDPVNLERAVRVGDPLGGHLVQGHVDGVGTVVQPAPELEIRAPAAVRRYLVAKGSVTVDGVSLTVVEASAEGFCVAVIPHTLAVTTLGRRHAGDRVNLEADVIAKYVERLLAGSTATPYAGLGRGAA